mmetsp:Transcript_6849/g.18385  ORF Transcript_6849/g.18385 Transcript_6849/m.18385 type:complete len:200 (+) Transcript_6849:719-1318(+)
MLALNSQERHATLAKGDGNDHLMLDTDGSAMLALFLRERHVALADGDGGDQLLPQLLAACVAGQVQLAEAGVRGREARCSVIGIIQPIHCNHVECRVQGSKAVRRLPVAAAPELQQHAPLRVTEVVHNIPEPPNQLLLPSVAVLIFAAVLQVLHIDVLLPAHYQLELQARECVLLQQLARDDGVEGIDDGSHLGLNGAH